MVMTISPTFQFFSNYFKTAWDFLNINNHNMDKSDNQILQNQNSILDINSTFDNNLNNFLEEFQREQKEQREQQQQQQQGELNGNYSMFIEMDYQIQEIEQLQQEQQGQQSKEIDNLNLNLLNDNKLLSWINSKQEIISSEFYIYRVLSWLLQHDSYFIMNNDNSEIHQLINHSLTCVRGILELNDLPPTILPFVIYYADNFVKRCGINNKQLLNLLISSAIVSVKFFGESYRVVGHYFNLTNKDLCYMERLFLNGINFELYTHNNQIVEFIDSIEKEKQTFIINDQIL